MSRMHHRREGYPFGSLVDFAPDSMGHPIFSFSPLAIHTRNLLADPRCTLVVQIPGWSGLSNARVTIFGDVYPLPEHEQSRVTNRVTGQFVGKLFDLNENLRKTGRLEQPSRVLNEQKGEGNKTKD
ncbi:Pyridoxamine 5'-phosphate oxidase family protein isoform 2 [Gossypium australe]|uniref:Pyridoxamine 5'-phosphate oxidase family protein isoform 2 n=1 Tax=Gossypium australe TaxID=47621 RepID=A0A5B6WS25_9ROSI|nr:Pyridoxamine 5'-phosphate oxidase family protein isoform 2 [Gossypium australe]